jgi:hypothetical protein
MADLEAITRDYLAAFQARDVEKCLGFFAEDGSVDFQDVEYAGRQALEDWHKERFQANLKIDKIENIKVKGDKVTVDAVVSSDRLSAWKIRSLKSRIEANFSGDKIHEAKLTARITNMFNMIRAGD